MILPLSLAALARLAENALVGRLLLALLPPGLPGRHTPRGLPSTWAASHLLGGLALALEEGLLHSFGLEPSPLLVAAPWLAVALLRWISLPGAMVPRYEPPAERPGGLARALWIAAALVVVGAALLGERVEDGALAVTHGADALALLALVDHALASARRAPLARALFVLALAGLLAAALRSAAASVLPLALSTGAGATLGIVWLRRGDRRAGALAVLAFASAACLGPREALYGVAGLVALWIHTAVPSRKPLALLAVASFAAAFLVGWSRRPPELELEALVPAAGVLVFLGLAFALLTRHRLLLARGSIEAVSTRDGEHFSPRAEASMLRDAVLLSLLPAISRGEFSTLEVLAAALLPIAPIVVTEAGLLLSPAERASARSSRSSRSDPDPLREGARR